MRRFWWWLPGLGGLGALGGCSNDEPDSYHEGVIAICDGACAAYRRCGLSGSDCNVNCVASYDPRGIRGSTLAVVGACVKDEDCATLASDDAFGPCFDSAAQAEPLRGELLAYCESASKNDFRCNVWWSVEDCTHTMGGWNDAVLEAAMFCHERACDEIQACEKATFEDPP